MFEVSTPLGHLVTVRWADMKTTEEALAFQEQVRQCTIQARPAALCADWRAGSILRPQVAEVLLAMFRAVNTSLVRAAILLPTSSATFTMQAERLVREANNPQRRTFRDEREHMDWLMEVLSPEELVVARQFIASGPR
jgi:hypothetical protein